MYISPRVKNYTKHVPPETAVASILIKPVSLREKNQKERKL